MSKTTIADPRIRIKPSNELLALVDFNKDCITEIPENLAKALTHHGYSLPTDIEILCKTNSTLPPKIDIETLNKLCDNGDKTSLSAATPKKKQKKSAKKDESKEVVYLYLSDLRWLNEFLHKLRKEKNYDTYLHKLLESCDLEMPQNALIPRDPILEARCQKLREEQQNREYRKMTKDVDAVLKNRPEDTIAYQIKALNAQIIAVLQFVFSVVAGFVFGFLGIELIIGNLDFGLRLLLGIMFALIIALAEIYFLAKKLNEYDDVGDTTTYPSVPSMTSNKVHVD